MKKLASTLTINGLVPTYDRKLCWRFWWWFREFCRNVNGNFIESFGGCLSYCVGGSTEGFIGGPGGGLEDSLAG